MSTTPQPATATHPLPSSSPQQIFNTVGLQPPSQLYMLRDDHLLIQCTSTINNETFTVNGRILRPDGQIVPFGKQKVLSSAFGVLTLDILTGDGWLLGVSVSCNSATARGQSLARGYTSRSSILTGLNSQVNTPLFSDYVVTSKPTGWPFGRLIDPTEGPGLETYAPVGNPAAGADIKLLFGTPVKARVKLLIATLVASATVANRIPYFALYTPVQNIHGPAPAAAQTASQTKQYAWAQGVQGFTDANGTIWIPMPADPVISTGTNSTNSVGTLTVGIQAADQWTTNVAEYEQWLDF